MISELETVNIYVRLIELKFFLQLRFFYLKEELNEH